MLSARSNHKLSFAYIRSWPPFKIDLRPLTDIDTEADPVSRSRITHLATRRLTIPLLFPLLLPPRLTPIAPPPLPPLAALSYTVHAHSPPSVIPTNISALTWPHLGICKTTRTIRIGERVRHTSKDHPLYPRIKVILWPEFSSDCRFMFLAAESPSRGYHSECSSGSNARCAVPAQCLISR